MAAPYVQVGTNQCLSCPDQPDPKRNPTPSHNPLTGLKIGSRSTGERKACHTVISIELHVNT